MTAESSTTDEFSEYRDEWESVISRLIARAWIDGEFKQQLLADPTPILHAEGLMFPERYEVEFFEDPGASPGDWHSVGRGMKAIHRFPIPQPPEEMLAADDQLGLDASALACCCPCASCTGAVSHATWTLDVGSAQ